MTVDEMLRDLRSVKMRAEERSHVDALRERFQTLGAITTADDHWLRNACRRYAGQLRLLHESRERARHTNALRAMGLTRDEVEARAAARLRRIDAENNDMGF
jgi:CO/xanthine dehydrogenase Mo-binding subunit